MTQKSLQQNCGTIWKSKTNYTKSLQDKKATTKKILTGKT